jgi:hypothetical protein
MAAENYEKACTVEEPSPFANLNDQFDKQNYELGELVNRLRSKLHKLSDTNFPTEENAVKESPVDLPFREGHLNTYYNKLRNNDTIISMLAEQVIKLEGLI